MLSRRWDEAETLFARGLESSEQEREALLAKVDVSLAGAVRELWKHYECGSILDSVQPDELLSGHSAGDQVAGRFTVLQRLGAGGMGEVYRARDERLGRDVALKFLQPEHALEPEWQARMEHEARVLCTLGHPNICTLYDLAWEGSTPFLVMEFLEGETLADRLQRGTPPHGEVVAIALQICAGLRQAHSLGIIHRDLKPSNVMLTPNGVKVLDFGIAKRARRFEGGMVTSLTDRGGVVGSAAYMSPEQACGKPLDERSDVFSLGCLLYEMVTGRRAFCGDSPWAVMAAVIAADPPPLTLPGHARPPLRGICERCLEKDPGARFQSVAEVEEALRGAPRHLGAGWLRWALSTGAAAVLVAVLAFVEWGPAATREPKLNSIVVLPFSNVGGVPEQDYLADGLSKSLTEALSRQPDLRVIAHTTALGFKGRQLDAGYVGKRLKVSALVKGEVSVTADRVRVEVELQSTEDGSELWRERYEGSAAQLIDVEQRLVRNLIEQARRGADGGKPPRGRAPTDNGEAYKLYLKARHALERNGVENLKSGLTLFQQALAIDPLFAQAYTGISEVYWGLAAIHLSPAEAMPKARAAAIKALEIDPSLAEAHLSLGIIDYTYNFAWDRSAKHFERAIELNPNYALARLFHAWSLIINRRFREGIAEALAAYELDPLSPFVETGLGQMHYLAGEHEASIHRLRNVVEFNPNFQAGSLWLGAAYLYANRIEDAVKQFDHTFRLDPSQGAPLAYSSYARARQGDREGAARDLAELRGLAARKYVAPYLMAVAAAGQGNPGEVVRWLRKSREARDDFIVLMNVDPVFSEFRGYPEFAAILRDLGFRSGDQ